MKKFELKSNYTFRDKKLLEMAMTHKSFSNEKAATSQTGKQTSNTAYEHNEKLEFLGDAVIDLVLAELLLEKFPNESEGFLSKKRASLVNETNLAMVAKDLELDLYLSLGRGEKLTKGREKPRLLASAFEALIGAIFLDSNYASAKTVIKQIITIPEQEVVVDFKSALQEIVQKGHQSPPLYKMISETGPSHEKMFQIEVLINNEVLGQGQGKSKKIAEGQAAEMALNFLLTNKESSKENSQQNSKTSSGGRK